MSITVESVDSSAYCDNQDNPHHATMSVYPDIGRCRRLNVGLWIVDCGLWIAMLKRYLSAVVITICHLLLPYYLYLFTHIGLINGYII